MGVRGLQTYVERDCPNACRLVSIEQMAVAHRKSNSCEESVLLVDGMSLANRLYEKSKIEWIYGGQWLEYFQVLESFTLKFKNIGIKLVFFFDGTVCSSKMEEWVRRRVANYEKVVGIFGMINSGYYHSFDDAKLFQLPTSAGNLTAFALKELGAEVHYSDKEADDVIVSYACQKQVFAILSQDSDFLIYNTKPYLSLTHLDMDLLQTRYYDRKAFAQHLNLREDLLPLFACLAGNHFISSDKLNNFHRKMSKQNRVYLAAMARNIANTIRHELWNGNINDTADLRNICLFVFGHTENLESLREGLKSYVIVSSNPCILTPVVKIHPDLGRAVYAKHLDCTISCNILNLLCKLEYGSSEVIEDRSILPSALVYRGIRQRSYGVLFNCFSSTQYANVNVIVKEWCAYPGNRMEIPEQIQPLKLKISATSYRNRIPAVEELWFQSNEREKMEILWAVLQIPMSLDIFLKLPKKFVVFASIINYLIGGLPSGPLLDPWVVAVFVAVASAEKNIQAIKYLMVGQIHPTALNLSTIFMRGLNMMMLVLGVCGNPLPLSCLMPWNFFDGKLFHHLYNQTKGNLSVNTLCSNARSTQENFYNLLSFVTNGTVYAVDKLNWKDILVGFQY